MIQSSYVSLITPFNSTGNIDLLSFENLVLEQLQANVSGFFLASEIGEGDFLNLDEKVLLAEHLSKILDPETIFYIHVGEAEIENKNEFFSRIYKTACHGVVVSLEQLKFKEEQELFELFVTLSNFKKQIILKDSNNLPNTLLEELLALPFVSAAYQKNSDLKSYIPQSARKFIEYDRGVLPLSLTHEESLVSYFTNIQPAFFHKLITASNFLACNAQMKKLSKLAFLQKQLSKEDPVLNIKAILSKQGKCPIFTRKNQGAVCENRLAAIEKSLEELKNA